VTQLTKFKELAQRVRATTCSLAGGIDLLAA